jgi:carboxymethylenebutenolidase
MRITAADGAKFSAYVAVPASGSGPAIVLLQEIFGVNAYIRGVADRYAEEGYVVLAPDIFHRLEPDVELAATEADFPKAFAFYEALDIDLAVSDVVATVAAARALPEVTARASACWASASAESLLSSRRRRPMSIARSATTAAASTSAWTRPARSPRL